MSHAHAHDHAHAHGASAGRALLWGLLLTFGFAGVEALAGWWSGSLALLGDAGHMVTDASALGLAALAAWIAKRPPSARHTFGLARAEVLIALLNALFMLVVVLGIVVEAVKRLQAPVPVQGGMVMGVAALGLLVNLGVAYLLSRGEENINTRAALLHVMGDLLGSVAALTAGAVIHFTGWTPIDPILSIAISLLILLSTFRLLREALHVLMEGVPLHLDLEEIGRAMARTEHVQSVHDLHVWTLSSGSIALSAHVLLDDLKDWQRCLDSLREMLHEDYGIDHVTLQPELATFPMTRTAYPPRQEHGRD
ncbi:MAG: cation diffusion facilitator family transporter [Pseudomonadota bacterium]